MRIVITEKKLSPLLTNTHKELGEIIQASSFIMERHYKRHLPVNKGGAVRAIKTIKTDRGYVVVGRPKSRGYNYLKAVYMGSGRYYGKPDAGYTTGRTRKASYSEDQITLFKVLAARGYRFNRKPNHFSDRAAKDAAPQIVRFINDQIGRVGNEA